MATKTKIVFSPISGANTGTRDCAVDFTDALETSETITGKTVTSADATVLSIVSSQVNTTSITAEDGSTIATGKGVQFQIKALQSVKRNITIDVKIDGNSGTSETYEIMVPVTDKLRE